MRQRSENYNTDGLTRREREVMRLWDEGSPIAAIAKATDTPIYKARDIVSALTEGNETRLHRKAMKDGSAQLLAALGGA